MDGKEQIVERLEEVFYGWEKLLSSLSEERVTAPVLPDRWSIKDKVAHVWSWQQVSVARMEAALAGTEPEYPEWWIRFAPDPEEDVDRTNAWLFTASHDKPWSQVYSDWKSQFQRYISLTKQVPEEDIMKLGRFSWMGKYALAASAMGSLEHHEEHLEDLQAWLSDHGVP
jgi:hypothetical protein